MLLQRGVADADGDVDAADDVTTVEQFVGGKDLDGARAVAGDGASVCCDEPAASHR